MYTSVTLVISPYHVGLRGQSVGAGPQAILDAGLQSALTTLKIANSAVTIEPVDTFEGEIGRSFELMRRIAAAVRAARKRDSFPIVLAGNCFSSVGVAAGLDDVSRDELGIVWHDAHDDYHTPDTLESGYFDAMGVSMLTGESWHELVNSIPGFTPLKKENVVFCGLRDVTDVERERVRKAGFKVVWGNRDDGSPRVDYAVALEDVLREHRSPTKLITHWDLDSLDSAVYGDANKFAAPGGLSAQDLHKIAAMLPSTVEPVALTVASFDPTCSDNNGSRIATIAVNSIARLAEGMLEHGLLGSKK